jgi:hypothetical protein
MGKGKKDNSAKIGQLNSEITALNEDKDKLQKAAENLYNLYMDFSSIAESEHELTKFHWDDERWLGNTKKNFNENIYECFVDDVVQLYEDIVTKHGEIQSKINGIKDDISDKQKEIKKLED